MKLTKIATLLIGLILSGAAACQRQPTQMNPGGYTGTNKTNNTHIHDGVKPGSESSESDGEHNSNSENHARESHPSETPHP